MVNTKTYTRTLIRQLSLSVSDYAVIMTTIIKTIATLLFTIFNDIVTSMIIVIAIFISIT